MSRLPIPGGDAGSWGDVLNDYLSQSHNADGTLKGSSVAAAGAAMASNNLSDLLNAATARTNLGLGSIATHATDDFVISGADVSATGTVQKLQNRPVDSSAPNDKQVLSYDAIAQQWVPADVTSSGTVPDATTTTKGIVQLAGDLSGVASAPTVPALVTKLTASNNLSDLANAGTARTNLGLGGAATLNVGTTTGTVASGDDSRITGAVQASTVTTKGDMLAATAASTLARLGVGTDGQLLTADSTQVTGVKWANAPSAPVTSVANKTGAVTLTNTDISGLGGAATLNVGTTTGTVAAGDDSRITGAAQKSANLSDLANTGTARTNLGLGGAATLNVGTTTGTVASGNDSRITGALQKTNNFSDITSVATARSNLGWGTYTLVPTGWGANWKAARAAAGSRLVKVAVIGDSIAQGWTGTSWWTNGWVGLLRSYLQTTYGDGGSGFITVDYMTNSGNNLTTGQLGSVGGNNQWSRFPDGNGNNPRGGLNWCSVKNASSGTGTMNIPMWGANSLKVYALTDTTYGSYSYAINSGTATTVAVNAASSIKTTTVASPPAGNYTLNLAVVSGTVELYGAAAYNSTGIAVDNLSVSGRNAANLLTATAGTNSNSVEDTASALGPWDLVIFALGVNDNIANIQGNLATNLLNCWSGIKTKAANATAPDAIIMVCNMGPGTVYGDVNHGEGMVAAECYRAAQAIGAAVVDIWSFAGRSLEPWNTNGYQLSNSVHPTNTGHQQYYNAIQPIVIAA